MSKEHRAQEEKGLQEKGLGQDQKAWELDIWKGELLVMRQVAIDQGNQAGEDKGCESNEKTNMGEFHLRALF